MVETAKPLKGDDIAGGPSGSSTPQGGLKGRIDPDNVEGGGTELKGKALLEAAQKRAPNLTQEFIDAYKLTDEEVRSIASGGTPPPPSIGPLHSTDLYLTPGGWQQTPPGVKPEDLGKSQVSR
jgi:hypothetical protein